MPRLLVIDTQALFDWLVFRNPVCAEWGGFLQSPDWEWIFTVEMRNEFDHVAARGFGKGWPVATEELAAAWVAHGRELPVPVAPGAADRLHCTDPDDQKFIDLAISAGAHTLVTRDKALLRLARRARERHGVLVRSPADWTHAAQSTKAG